jgi:hypothetical protein
MTGSGQSGVLLRLTLALAFWLCLCLAAGEVRAQNQPVLEVRVSLSRDSIGMDEQAVLEIVVKGATQNMPEPNLPTLPMFEVYSQGRSTNISYTNGRVEASVTNRFMILPTKAGVFPIENISVVYQNKRYVGNSVTLTVVGQGTTAAPQLEERARDTSGKSRDHFLEALVDNDNPFVNQQVTLTLKFYIAVQYYGSPELIEPTTTGFWTELLGTKGPYQQRVNNRTYRVIERKYALFPTRAGELTIGRATIGVTVPSRQRTRRRDPFDIFGMLGGGQEVQVRSTAVPVTVRPLPARGRPGDFSGTIGRFTFKATPNKREVEVNQPVSVSFAISGVGNIKSVAEPQIPDLPDFRVYKASSSESTSKLNDRIGGTKTFEEVFIPKRPGRLDIPSLSFNFFDPDAERYRTVHTQSIKLQVLRTEGYIAAPDVPYTSPDMTIGADSRDIRFIKNDLGDLHRPEDLLITSAVYLTVNAIPVLALMATVAFRRRREKLSGDVGYARARRASKEARRRLSKAKSLATEATSSEFFVESSQAVLSFIGDKLNISPHGLTNDKITILLQERGDDAGLIRDTISFLDRCGFARYAPSATGQHDIDEVLKDAENLMVRMEEVRF